MKAAGDINLVISHADSRKSSPNKLAIERHFTHFAVVPKLTTQIVMEAYLIIGCGHKESAEADICMARGDKSLFELSLHGFLVLKRIAKFTSKP